MSRTAIALALALLASPATAQQITVNPPLGLPSASSAFTCTAAGVCTIASGVAVTTPNIVGVTNASSAAAGSVGERLDASASLASVSLVNNTAKTVTSVSLTAGDWEVSGNIYFLPGASTTVTGLLTSISATDNTVDANIGKFTAMSYPSLVLGQTDYSVISIPPTRVNVSTTTIYYLVANAAFGVSTMTAGGNLHAVRIR